MSIVKQEDEWMPPPRLTNAAHEAVITPLMDEHEIGVPENGIEIE